MGVEVLHLDDSLWSELLPSAKGKGSPSPEAKILPHPGGVEQETSFLCLPFKGTQFKPSRDRILLISEFSCFLGLSQHLRSSAVGPQPGLLDRKKYFVGHIII